MEIDYKLKSKDEENFAITILAGDVWFPAEPFRERVTESLNRIPGVRSVYISTKSRALIRHAPDCLPGLIAENVLTFLEAWTDLGELPEDYPDWWQPEDVDEEEEHSEAMRERE